MDISIRLSQGRDNAFDQIEKRIWDNPQHEQRYAEEDQRRIGNWTDGLRVPSRSFLRLTEDSDDYAQVVKNTNYTTDN